MTKEQIISELKNGNQKTLKDVYLNHITEFFKFSNRYNLSEDDLKDIYQDAIIVFYENVQKGKLDELSCSIRTYVFSVGKYMIFDKSRRDMKTYHPVDNYVFDTHDYATMDSVLTDDGISIYQKKLLRNFKRLGDKCKEILDLFYYRGLTIDEIVDVQGYENKNVVQSQKSRCLKTLKELIKNEDE